MIATTAVHLEPDHLALLRSLVLSAWPGLRWRHHGIGLMQAYLPGRDDVRLHVWHPSLETAGMVDSGAMHDHRYSFLSTVLLGEVHHHELMLRASRYGTHEVYTVVNASQGKYDVPQRASVGFEGGPERYNLDHLCYAWRPGTAYTFDEGAFHHGFSRGLAVSLVRRYGFRDSLARLLAPVGTTPVHAFQEGPPPSVTSEVLAEARAALTAEAGGAS